jgi:hypothetical protein
MPLSSTTHASVFDFSGRLASNAPTPCLQAYPNILWCFLLTPRWPCARIRANIRSSQGNSGPRHLDRRHKSVPVVEGRRYAISARLHGAMYQSSMRSTRPLAPRRRHPTLRPRRPLPLLRRCPPQRAAPARSALPHAPASADGASAAAPPRSLRSPLLCAARSDWLRFAR